MALRVYALIKFKNKVVGYRVLNEDNGQKLDLNNSEIRKITQKRTFSNVRLEGKSTGLVLAENSIKKMPYYSVTDNMTYNNKASIICKYVGKTGVCFKVCNGYGSIIHVGLDRLLKINSTLGLSNAKVVNYKGTMFYVVGLKHSIPTYALDLSECKLISLNRGYSVAVRDGKFMLLDEYGSIVEVANAMKAKWLAPVGQATYDELLLGYHNTCVTYNTRYSERAYRDLITRFGVEFTWCYKSFTNDIGDTFFVLEKNMATKGGYGGMGLYCASKKDWVIPPYFGKIEGNIRQLNKDIVVGGLVVEDIMLSLEVTEILWVYNLSTYAKSAIKYTSVELDGTRLKAGVLGLDNKEEYVYLDKKTLKEIGC